MEYTRKCVECGQVFTTERKRKICSKECYRKRHIRQTTERKQKYPKCKCDGCSGRANRVASGLCENCFYRLRRTGTTAKRPLKTRTTHHGYWKIKAPDHPLCVQENGWVFEHRVVLWDKIGVGPHPCHWCGIEMSWTDLVVDHLNQQKDDNRPENLVPSCNTCNRLRSMPFVERVLPDRFGQFMQLLVNRFQQIREQSATTLVSSVSCTDPHQDHT